MAEEGFGAWRENGEILEVKFTFKFHFFYFNYIFPKAIMMNSHQNWGRAKALYQSNQNNNFLRIKLDDSICYLKNFYQMLEGMGYRRNNYDNIFFYLL